MDRTEPRSCPDGAEKAIPAVPVPDCRLGPDRRLISTLRFAEAFAQGRRVAGRYQVMWLRSGEGASLRLGVVTSRRALRRAVDRVRARRLIREAFRRNRWRLSGAQDVVLVARSAILDGDYSGVEQDLMKLAVRAGLMADDLRKEGAG